MFTEEIFRIRIAPGEVVRVELGKDGSWLEVDGDGNVSCHDAADTTSIRTQTTIKDI
jgi:hypothetical protein